MDLRLAVAVLAGLAVSCVHTARVARTPVAKPPAAAAAASPFEQQIQNARNAGSGDYELVRLREQVAAEPGNVTARLALAAAYRDRGYPDVALEISRLAADRFPESGAAELALVRDLRAVKQVPQAVASLETFLKAHPQTGAEYESWLGILLDESGQWASGEEHHRRAVERTPGDDSLHNNLGYNLLMQKKNREAAEEFREALKRNPASQIARNNLGMALAAGDAAAAVASFQTGADRATAHSNLAAVLMENGNYAEARQELQIALGYDKTNAAALRNLELVSRLDGQDATLPGRAPSTRWKRLKTGFVRLFYGPLEEPKAEGTQSASAH